MRNRKIGFGNSSSLILSTLLMFGLLACTKKDQVTKKEEKAPDGVLSVKDPVALVNGEKISAKAFQEIYDRTKSRFKGVGRIISPTLEAKIKKSILQKLIDDSLVKQRAKQEGLFVSEAEGKKAFADYKKKMGGEEAFSSFLKQVALSENQMVDLLKVSLLKEKLLTKLVGDINPKDQEVKEYYEKYKDQFKKPEQVKASHILIKLDANADQKQKDEKRAQAQKILAEVKAAKSSFAELAKKYSEGPSAPRGGDLGFFSRGQMVKSFENAVFVAKKGAIVGPIETKFGFHIINVIDKKKATVVPFKEARKLIMASLVSSEKAKRSQTTLKDLRTTAEIKVLDKNISLEAPKAKKVEDKKSEG